MNNALYIAATGMKAQQLGVDTIANNLANVNTIGFKGGQVRFSDLVQVNGMDPTNEAATTASFGSGVDASVAMRIGASGELKKTDGMYDLAIDGAGFLEVALPDGTVAYSRGGTLQVTKEGLLADGNGYPLAPSVHVGQDVKAIAIGSDGVVKVQVSADSAWSEVGRVELASFTNPEALISGGHNLFYAHAGAGDVIRSPAGESGIGLLRQGHLESSNVKMVDEMVNLMIAQRAYEMNVKVIQASDDMLAMSNNLRR